MAGAPPRSAELDFADVFGGPPRRASGNERRSIRGSLDSSSFRSSAPRARSGEAEAPVFGDRGSGDRRRHLWEEFYRDIFPGGEAALPSRAGAGDWGDVFGRPASPGSRTPPRSSFSMNINLGADSSMLTSPTRETSNRNDDGTSYTYSVPPSPNSHMNDYLAQETSQQDSRKNTFSGHRYPFLSRFRSQSGDNKNTSNHVSSVESEYEGIPLSMESFMASNKFHFSFYKWAGKGAMLVLPAAMEEKDAGITRLKSFPQVVVQGVDLIDEHDSMSNATDTSKNQTDYEDSKSGKYSTVSPTQEGHVPLFSDDDYMQGMKHSTSYSKNDVSSDSLSAKSSRLPSGERSRSSRVKGKVKGFMKMFSPEASPKSKGAPEVQDQTSIVNNECKTELRDKFTLFSYEASEGVKINVPSTMSEVQGRMKKPVLTRNSKMDATSERNEAVPDGIKQSTGYSKDGVQSGSLSTKSSRPPSGERSRSSRVKGKMKDFVKIFSLEGSPKRKDAPEALDQTSSAKNGSKTELQDKFTLSSFEACEDLKTIQNNQSTFIDVPSTISEVQESMEKSILTRNSKMEGKMGITSERNEHVPNESIGSGKKDKLESTIHHEEIYVEDLDGFLVEHITEDHLLHNDREKDQIKIAESKIREWSRGKERNIRSLLSTLQYVLWPESGWKAIPLVDVIEGAAVKKAYQKALLCLHPDKLQQRGAAMHHKYIAEKVFDILQESWKEFNSVTFG